MLGKTLGFILLLGLVTASDCLAESCHINSANASLLVQFHAVLGSSLKSNRSVASPSGKVKAKVLKNRHIDILGVAPGEGHLGW